MNFHLFTAVTDVIAQEKSDLVYQLSNKLNAYFRDKDYGADVKSVEIGLLMTLTRKGFEDWYQPARIHYIDYRQITSRLTGELIEIEKTLRYELKLGNEYIGVYLDSSDVVSVKVLADQLLQSLLNFDNLPKAIQQFDVARFKDDMRKALGAFQEAYS